MGWVRDRLNRWARTAKRELYTVYYASRHPRTPRVAKLFAGLVLLYALSPVDLIPDFIPVLGYMDDAILLPLGILLVARLVPAAVWTECRAQAEAQADRKLPRNRAGVALVVGAWCLLALGAWCFVRGRTAG